MLCCRWIFLERSTLASESRPTRTTAVHYKSSLQVSLERALQQHSRWTGGCSALQQLSGKQAKEVCPQRQRCSAAAFVFALRSALQGRVAEEAAALPLLERLLNGGLCLGLRGGGDRTKLDKCLAQWVDLLFGEHFHSFDV